MTEFQLDTSGSVDHVMTEGCVETGLELEWEDLDAFTQGYIEALFREASDDLADEARANAAREDDTIDLDDQPEAWRDAYRPGFSDLAPETLARIIADCAAWSSRNPDKSGRFFWETRQAGERGPWKPLTPTLDDGKVYFGEGA